MHIGSGLNTVSSMYRQQKGNNMKTPASGEAMCGQGFPPLTVVLILPYFLKLLDYRTPLLFRNTLFLSQLVRDLGWEASACHPL